MKFPRSMSRRRFMSGLGLGAGARLLAPIAGTLFAEAMGYAEVQQRRRFVVFMGGNGINVECSSFVPVQHRQLESNSTLLSTTDYQWGRMLRNLEPYRNRMLLVDGLSNEIPHGAHTSGYGTLSGFAAANGSPSEWDGPPGNITIDQFVGNAIGNSTRWKTLLAGNTDAGMFASGHERRERHFTSPSVMYDTVYGSLVGDGAGPNKFAVEQKLILDRLRGDIAKLNAALAGPERRKLEHYVQAIEEFEKREKLGATISCKAPAAPTADAKSSPEDRLEAMNEMLILGLTCGLTNVAALAANTGNSHTKFQRYTRIHVGTQFEAKGGIDNYGHDGPELEGASMDLIHDFNGGLMARMAQALSGIKEGDRSIFDNTVMVYISDGGDGHHGYRKRFPVVVLGTAGGKIRADGRYLRWPDKGKPGARSLCDLWSTLATAVGAPTDSFGKGGVEKVEGPLPEIMG